MAERKAPSSGKKTLTAELLKKKQLRTKTIQVPLGDEVYDWQLQAISGNRLDALQNRFPPTKEQRSRGMSFNAEKFGPALLAECSVVPELSLEDAKEIWASDEWTTGELNTLFNSCIDLCMGSLEVPTTATD